MISIHCAKVTLEEMLEFQIGNDKNGRNILMVILQKKTFSYAREKVRERKRLDWNSSSTAKVFWRKKMSAAAPFVDQRICLIDGKDLAFQIPHLVLHDFFSPSLSVLFAAITAQHSWIKHCIFSPQNTFQASKINLAVTVFENHNKNLM